MLAEGSLMTSVSTKFNVGGVLLDRPFKVRRLGHFGFNVLDLDANRHFYSDLLGFRISDVMGPDDQPRGVFMRYGGDHHAFVLFRRQPEGSYGPGAAEPGVTLNQITWQVGSLAEVRNAADWLAEQGVKILRTGRDMPGSNWHTYIPDPYGHTNELYYGIEQIGWDGLSKPRTMYDRGFREPPALPQINEYQEVQDAIAAGTEVHAGYRHVESLPAEYEVDGIMLPRPFKITRIGPVSLFVPDVHAAEAFYTQSLGFVRSEEATWHGHRSVFLRANTEHHSLALYPMALRSELGFSPHTTCMAFGVQLANYRQLRDAVSFLQQHGVRVDLNVSSELYPGIDYAAHAFDPDGHCIQLYYYMEQLGWDGKPRPAEQRRRVEPGVWPETLEPMSDSFMGEALQGPWG
jgi:catechol 2,3-dioxygenase-like lactoylglutathione lyase family enzyme